MKTIRMVLALGAILMSGAVDAEARPGRWGPRAGLRFDGPDQLVIGAHADFGEFTENLRFRPMIDLGIGDNVTLITVNPEALYFFPDARIGGEMQFYAGAGLAFLYFNFDERDACRGLAGAPRDACEDSFDDTDTEIGINLVAGLERELSGGNSWFAEFRMTVEDGSFLQITGGYTFGR